MLDQARETRPGRFVLPAILALALLLRLPGLIGRGPWLDERVSLNEAVGSYYRGPMPGDSFTPADLWAENTPRNVVLANQSGEGGLGLPYHLLLHFWINAFGPGELAVRGLSLLLGLATVGLTFGVGRGLLGTPGGSVAALVCSLHPLQITMSQEVRPYALATALSLVGSVLLVQLAREEPPARSRWKALGLAASLALAFMSHYAAASVVAGILLFGLGLALTRPTLRPILGGAFVLFSGCLLVWLLTIGLDGLRHFAVESAARRAALAVGDPGWAWVHPASPRYLLAGSAGALLALLGSTLQSTVRIGLLLPFVALWGFYLFQGWRVSRTEDRRAAWLGSAVIACGLLLAVLSALANGHDSGLAGRYFAFHVPYAAVLISAALVRLPSSSPRRRLSVAAVGLHALLILASLPSVFHQFTQERRPNIYADIAGVLRRHQRQAALATFPAWIDARTVSIFEGPDITIAHRVLDRPADEVILYDAGGQELQRLRIDRAHAR